MTLAKAAEVLVLVALSVAFLRFLEHALLSVAYPYGIDFGEAPLLDQAAIYRTGHDIYASDFRHYPFIASDQPPLMPLALALLTKLFGISFLPGRILVVVSALGSAFLVGLISQAWFKDRFAAIMGGLAFLAIPWVAVWAGLARVDYPALLLSLSALYVAVRLDRRPVAPYLAALLATLSVFFRYTYGLAVIPIFMWFALSDRRPAWRFLATFALSSTVALATMAVLTRGGILRHTIWTNVYRLDPNLLAGALLLTFLWAPMLVICGIVFARRSLRAPTRARITLLCYLGASLGVALTTMRLGSSINYLIELAAALTLSATALVALWRKELPSRQYAVRLVVGVIQVGGFVAVTGIYAEQLKMRYQMLGEVNDLSAMVRCVGGQVLADERLDLQVLAGYPILFQPLHYARLAATGRWDESIVVADVASEKFGLILISEQPPFSSESLARQRWSPGLWNAVHKAYVPVASLGGATVLVPRSAKRADWEHCITGPISSDQR